LLLKSFADARFCRLDPQSPFRHRRPHRGLQGRLEPAAHAHQNAARERAEQERRLAQEVEGDDLIWKGPFLFGSQPP